MKNLILSTVIIGATALPLAAQPAVLTGSIGPYEIEAELFRSNGYLVGRYRYIGREAWIDLNGEVFGQQAARMEETVDGETTGTFYLDVENGGFEGVWVAGDTEYPVTLAPSDSDLAMLLEPIEEPEINTALTGQYHVGHYWVNGLFAPNFEIGFNGGTVNVLEITDTSVFVKFEFIVGPTYHFASFEGIAHQTGQGQYTHKAVLPGQDEPCVLMFQFRDLDLAITDEGNAWNCGFGARAHANFELPKVNDTAEFRSDWQ